MSLAPKFAGQKLSSKESSSSSGSASKHTLEIYLDYVCPFSAKIFNTIYNDASFRNDVLLGQYADKLDVIFRQQIQPWHPSSTLVHESAYAVLRLSPSSFYAYSALLFAHQRSFFDVSVVNETRNQTYRRLAALAGTLDGVDEEAVYKLLEISDKPGEDGALNSGNGVTDDVKVQVRANRRVGTHVTPTVVLDGIEKGEVSSGWTREQWVEWLGKNVV
ncbi:hypothetical protein BU24DRAFT_424404 [Aaosphaeria arxii CBS 175.79]|uniref:Uncharacterized protein n=1 Tax=Aaosphaeria arxii CBS 175.79 TaxID=1450172 RepID=A0A6A5XKC2_9PLEO|nr:uncharacterized protein BU24DRAFT_424404 [Aaosphaeria arxii CBS 175.79]KAF2013403.1 hypothetical protein BU24DRAFT_424404 [Aaosphaeria arxii CBS 175.79]